MKFTAIIAQAPDGAAPPADAAGKGAPPAGGIGAFVGNPLFMIVLLGLFFLVVMLPAQRRQKREAAAKLLAMKPGAKVITNSGIVGRIVTMKDGEDEIVIKSDDTKLRILKSTVGTVVSEEAATTDQKS